jgi:arylsulfatase
LRTPLAFVLPLVLAAAPRAAAAPPAPADTRPNILLIVADDLGYSDLGVLGGEIRTPNLDALAHSGLLLRRFLVSPACSPTRAMLLTGVDTHPAGLGTMEGQADASQKGRPGYAGQLSSRVVSVAELLRGSGYRTYLAGKWHLGRAESLGPQRLGFERSFALLQGGASHFADAAPITEKGAAEYREDGRAVELPPAFYSTAHFTDTLIRCIGEGLGDGRPFFAYAAYTSPHWPLQVPDAELDRYRGAYDDGYDALRARRFEAARKLGLVPEGAPVPARTPFARAWSELPREERRRQARTMEVYAAMVENLDHHVGRLLRFLEQKGELDRTLVVFFSDNGPEGNPIGRMSTNADWLPKRFDSRLANLGRAGSYAWLGPGWAQATTPFRLWKSFPTEGGVRVPAIVRLGASRRGGSDEPATVKDVVPTLLELASVRHPAPTAAGRAVAPLEGRSLVPFLRGDADSVHPGGLTMGFELFGRRALVKGRHKIVWLYEPYGPGRWELFDVVADPTESRDLAAAQPAKLAELLQAWDEYARANEVVLPARDAGYALEPAR